MKNRLAFAMLFAIPCVGGVAASDPATAQPGVYRGQALAGQARVTIEAARMVALRVQPGRVSDQELEKEAGGSGLRYSFDIRRGGRTYEVGVDAASGRVLENHVEGPNPD